MEERPAEFIIRFQEYGPGSPGEVPELWKLIAWLGGGWVELKNLETGKVTKERRSWRYERTILNAVQRVLIDTRHALDADKYPGCNPGNISTEVLERRIIWLTAMLAHVWKPVIDDSDALVRAES